MNLFLAVTDNDWFRFLRSRAPLDEVNFWRPSGAAGFRALVPGEPLLFKLHAPENYLVGGPYLFSNDDDLLENSPLTAADRRRFRGGGAVYVHRSHLPVGRLIVDLERLAKAGGPEKLAAQSMFLPL